MAGMSMLKGKYKYMPLSEANVKPVMVAAFDGQNIYVPGAASSFSTSSSSSSSAFSSSSFPSPMTATAEPKLDARYSMGNYLGGGIAGVVNEAYDKLHQRHVAIKMLNPVGYKLSTPSVLRRAEIIKKGVPFLTGHHLRSMTRDHVYWVKLPAKRELVACYVDARGTATNSMAAVTPQMLKELTLEMCVSLWGLDADEDDDNDKDEPMNGSRRLVSEDGMSSSSSSSPSSSLTSSSSNISSSSSSSSTSSSREPRHSMGGTREEMKGLTSSSDGSGDLPMGNDDEELMMTLMMSRDSCDDEMLFLQQHRHEHVTVGEHVYTIPSLPAKFRAFLQSRKSIYREIAHMHKLTGNSVSGQVAHGGHDNVLKLYDVLEYIQPSKSTIFLVLELASGGELFDRIRSDNGVDERVARGYFTQLLAGVLFCHQLGIVHRDLKPENLLLSDADVLKIADFGLSAHFIAAVSSGGSGAGVSASAEDDARNLYSGAAMLPELDDDQDGLGVDSRNGSMLLPAARFRRLNSIVGSPHYVAPEVLQNARYGYDGRKADMWSVGVILYGLLAGSLPFGKELPTCPRYLKFCEWIRSLPCDPQTGKLVFDVSIYQPTPLHARIPSSSISNGGDAPVNTTTADDVVPMTTTTFRIAQVHPNNCQILSSSSSSSRWLQQTPPLPPVKPTDVAPSSSSSTLANGAPSGRRGSRVVAFPSWLFPSKLSPHAVFLLASLLHPEPGKRASCEETCRSTWVADVAL